MRNIYSRGLGTHRQRVSTTFLTWKNSFSCFFNCLLMGLELGFGSWNMKSDALPSEPRAATPLNDIRNTQPPSLPSPLLHTRSPRPPPFSQSLMFPIPPKTSDAVSHPLLITPRAQVFEGSSITPSAAPQIFPSETLTWQGTKGLLRQRFGLTRLQGGGGWGGGETD